MTYDIVQTTYSQADETGVDTPGKDCQYCGRPGHEHQRERVNHETGYSYDLVCPLPGGDEA